MAQSIRALIIGNTGRLGATLVRLYSKGLEVRGLGRRDIDLSHPEQIRPALDRLGFDFDVLVNCAGMTSVDACERDPDGAIKTNRDAAREMALACAQRNARMIQVSTDYVFAGDDPRPRTEEDPVGPLGWYGRSKLEGEQAVAAALPNHLIVRVSWLFGNEGAPAFPDRILQNALASDHVEAVNDKWSCPTYADDLADWLKLLLPKASATGTLHLCNTGSCTWQEYGQNVLDIGARLGLPLKTKVVHGIPMKDLKQFVAPRPPHTALDTGRFTSLTGIQPRPWREAVEQYLVHHGIARLALPNNCLR